MKNSKNSIQNSESKRHLYIFLCAAVLIGLTVFALGDVAETMMTDKGVDTHLSSAKVEALGHTRFRFRRIYNGGDVSAHHTSSTVMPSASLGSSKPLSHAASAPSAASSVAPVMPTSGSMGYTMHTSSSQEPHSYGGGAAIGGGFSATAGSSVSSAPMAYSSAVSATPMLSAHRRNMAMNRANDSFAGTRTAVRMGTETKPSGEGEDGMTSPGGEWIWDGDAWDWVLVNPSTRPEDMNQVGTPLGDAPWLLMLLLFCGYALFCARRRRAAAE